MHIVITLHLFATDLVASLVVDECNWINLRYSRWRTETRIITYIFETIETMPDDFMFLAPDFAQSLALYKLPFALKISSAVPPFD